MFNSHGNFHHRYTHHLHSTVGDQQSVLTTVTTASGLSNGNKASSPLSALLDLLLDRRLPPAHVDRVAV